MKKILMMIACMLALSPLAACQATPDKAVVIQKDQEQLIKKAKATQSISGTPGSKLADKLDVPKRFTANESYSGKLKLTADAEIILPDADAMPVMRVEPENFSQEQVGKIYGYLVGDTKMYQQQMKYTKDQIMDEIVSWQKTLNDPSSAGASKKQAKQEISKLQTLYDSAPEKVDMIAADSTIKTQYEYDFTTGKKTSEFSGVDTAEKPGLMLQSGKTFYVKNNTKNGKITITKEDFGGGESGATVTDTASQGARIYYSNNDLIPQSSCQIQVETASPESYTEKPNTSGVLSYKKALETADDFIKKTGIKDMKVGKMTLFYVLPDKYQNQSVNNKPTDSKAFIDDVIKGKYDKEILDVLIDINLVRTVNGIPVTNGDISSYIGDAMYGAQWYYESFDINLSSKGIRSVSWVSPHKVTETVTKDTSMKPFNDIAEVFNKMYRVTYEARAGNGSTLSGKVTKVTLTLRRIMDQNKIGYGLFVPAWDFYGTMDQTTEGQTLEVISGKPLLTINAIDGSVIDLDKGY